MKKRLLTNRSGFTLVEAVLSLLMVSIGVMILGIFLPTWRRSEVNSFQLTDFYSYLDTTENHRYRLKKAGQHRVELSGNGKMYILKLKNNRHLLMMTTNRGGYMPLLKNVKSVNWSYRRPVLHTVVTMENGQRFKGNSDFK